jgi:hypothetical protein
MCIQSCEPLNKAVEFVKSCASGVNEAFTECVTNIEQAREGFVRASYEKCPTPLAIVIEKVSMAVPETFVALASLVGGIVTLPALLLSCGRKVFPMVPLLQNIMQGRLSTQDLGNGCRQALDGFNDMFEKTLVPALFVALTVDTIYSFVVGWLTADWGGMLHATAIALPGAFLAARHMFTNTQPGYSLAESPQETGLELPYDQSPIEHD